MWGSQSLSSYMAPYFDTETGYVFVQNGILSAVRPKLGKPAWVRPLNAQLPWRWGAPLSTGTCALAATSTGISAFEVEKGDFTWSFFFPGSLTGQVMAHLGGTIYVGLGCWFFAFNESTGSTLWQEPSQSSGGCGMGVAVGLFFAYFVTGNGVSAVRRSTGATAWSWNMTGI